MPSYVVPKRATAFVFYVGLPSTADANIFQANPTLATGDAKVSIDGAAIADLATLPDVDPNSSKLVKISLSASEMTGDNIQVILSDAAGAEWKDVICNIQTAARQIDDLAYPATTGRSLLVAAAGGVAPDWANVQAPTTTVDLSGTTIKTTQVVASVTGAVGSVTGAVGSVTGAVGSVTGNVGGNVTGSVGSVTGAVGSVTGNVGGNVTGSIGSLATQAKADVNGEVVDALNVDTYAEPTGVPPSTSTLVQKIGRLYAALRNGVTVNSATGKKQFLDDANAATWEKDFADAAGVYTETKGNAP